MFFDSFDYPNIVSELTHQSYHEDDINILIGVNGCGKSRLLREVQTTYEHYYNETIVLAIAKQSTINLLIIAGAKVKFCQHQKAKGG